MQAFKINFIELLVIILLSVPMGGFLYFNNSSKIKYDFEVKVGHAVTANLCENFSFEKKELLNNIDFDQIYYNHKNKISNFNYSFATKNNFKNGKYKITFNGKYGQEKQMLEKFNELFLDIKNKEIINFNNYFKSINYNCNSKELPAFKMIHAEIISNKITLIRRYDNLHLYFLLLSPLIMVYLLLIAYKYIRNKNLLI
jgi:hypothetical protein